MGLIAGVCDDINYNKDPAFSCVDMGGRAEGNDKNIKTKRVLFWPSESYNERLNQIDVSAEWRRSWSFGDPKQFTFL